MSSNSEWVSLRHAADILGVHPATVRNWADKGELPTRRTPGGHRRFRRSDLLGLAESNTEDTQTAQTNEVKLILQNALGQARMQAGSESLEASGWYERMSDGTRQHLREQGRVVLEALRAFLASGNNDENLAAAVNIGKTYAKALHDDDMSLPDATRGFFYFSEFVMESVLNWSEVSAPRDPHEWANLLRQVNHFNNAILLSIVEYYEED
jgi:excisionase family DNA binding protein